MTVPISEKYIEAQKAWSKHVFGPGPRTEGLIEHIKKELHEIQAEPGDLHEWVDVIILAIDGAWRAGFSPEEIINALHIKQGVNLNRAWPDWRKYSQGEAIEHIRD